MTIVHHSPVLLNEAVDLLITKKTGKYFEGTLGFGGHSEKILQTLAKKGFLVSTDVDINAIDFSRNKFKDDFRIKIYDLNFSLVDVIAKVESIKFFDGIFADLGVSSFQLDNSAAGFSYSSNALLDLRLSKGLKTTAADFINNADVKEITRVLFDYGEEKNSRKIANLIIEKRKIERIETTKDLKEIVAAITPERFLVKSLSRVFQALRILVNDELKVLGEFLSNSIKVLAEGGRLVIISYHSLEDRIVKEFFKYESLDCICPKDSPICTCNKTAMLKIITKKPIVPSEEEIKINRRARSAKMRVAEKL